MFIELPGLAERLPLLSGSHQKQIEALQKAGKLPDTLSKEFLDALFELSSELQAVDLDLGQLGQFLLSAGGALKEDELRTAIDQYLKEITKGYSHDTVRIKVTFNDGAEG